MTEPNEAPDPMPENLGSTYVVIGPNGVTNLSADFSQLAARGADSLSTTLGMAMHHSEHKHGTDQWWVCPASVAKVAACASAWMSATWRAATLTGPSSGCAGWRPEDCEAGDNECEDES